MWRRQRNKDEIEDKSTREATTGDKILLWTKRGGHPSRQSFARKKNFKLWALSEFVRDFERFLGYELRTKRQIGR